MEKTNPACKAAFSPILTKQEDLPWFSDELSRISEHNVLEQLAEVRQRKLSQSSDSYAKRRLEGVADTTAGPWLEALPVCSNCVLSDRDVVSFVRYMLGVCPSSLPKGRNKIALPEISFGARL